MLVRIEINQCLSELPLPNIFFARDSIVNPSVSEVKMHMQSAHIRYDLFT